MVHDQRLIAPDDLFRLVLVGQVAVRPGHADVFYVEKAARRDTNDYRRRVMRIAPGEEPTVFSGGPDDHGPAVSPDGRWLAFLGKRTRHPQVWLMDLVHGGEAVKITDIEGGVAEFRWSPDSRRLAVAAWLDERGIEPERDTPPEEDDLFRKFTRDVKVITELRHKLDGEGWYGPRRKQVVVVSLPGGAPPRQLTYPPFAHHDLSWTPDGRHILFLSRRGPDYDRSEESRLYIVPADGSLEPTTRWDTNGLNLSAAAVSPDGRTVAVLASRTDQLGYDNTRLYLADMEGGALREAAPAWDRPFGDISVHDMPAPGGGGLIWSRDGHALYSLSSVNAAVHLARVSVEDGRVELLTRDDQVHYSYALDEERGVAVLAASRPLDPSVLLGLDLDTGRVTDLATPNRAVLASLKLSPPRRFKARAADGPPVDGFIMEPVDRIPGRRYPTVLEIHGGPMMMYSHAFFFEFQWLAANGYGVVYANPRGSQGYGFEFCRAIQYEWGDKDYQDIMAALDQALEDEAWIDPERLGVAGGSYGGYMTNWIVGHTDRFKAAVTMRSVVDWRSMVGSGDMGWLWIRRAGVPPWADDTWYRRQSPITYVDNIVTPLLIEHQEGDLRCPIGQGEALYTAVKFLGKAPVRFVRYPNEFHGMSRDGKPWHRIHRLREIAAWFRRYLEPA
jgi:dipeptidyl aminopeptidase/acylaminoacyl peptidase